MTNEMAVAIAQAVVEAIQQHGGNGGGGTLNIFSEWIQMGFAGFCLLLVVVLMWLVRAGIKNQRDQQRVLMEFSASVMQNTEVTRALGDTIRALTETVLRRSGCGGADPDVGADGTPKIGRSTS